ncbi:S8 family peptidase [Streptomyces sp. LP05-1]|uniref:S8 family peptidase n=1 Tax=Streptomyces pyxinae TaxID=2970734 RepID=A0ABT2CDG9_9ACTN|nr:S8 family peptidase [Streptomyces sp. LP05-1]MCS0635469.1 S8 family peptidase [Streptomyces sp. LP05-1]
MTTRKRGSRLAAALAAVAGVSVLGMSFAGAAVPPPKPPAGTVHGAGAQGAVTGSYIVLLHGRSAETDKAAKQRLAQKYGGTLKRTYSFAVNGFSADNLSEAKAKELAADPAVSAVVQNKTFRISSAAAGATTVSATQENPPSWGLDRIDQTDAALDKKFTYPDTAGEGVTAYVVDTGVRLTHQDFEGRATSGFDAIDNDTDASDGHGHGTHVAATLAGAAHGVAKKAKIVAVRVLDDSGAGTTDQVVAGIDWVTEHHQGPSVANMSLGGGADQAMDAAVRGAVAAGITFGVAAGNESQDVQQVSPARVAEAITVASSTTADQQSDFSNFGTLVDLYAPGSSITSAWNDSDTGTKTLSGTSMATPHVVGAAAIYLAGHPDATPEQVTRALVDGATAGKITNATQGTPNKLLRIVQ